MVGGHGALFWQSEGQGRFLQCLWDGTKCVFLRKKQRFCNILGAPSVPNCPERRAFPMF